MEDSAFVKQASLCAFPAKWRNADTQENSRQRKQDTQESDAQRPEERTSLKEQQHSDDVTAVAVLSLTRKALLYTVVVYG